MTRYYVWKNRGTRTRPVPLVSEGYRGPYTLDTALLYARSASVSGRYGCIVSENTDPSRLRIRAVYSPGNQQHAEDLAVYLQQEFYEGDYIDVAYDLFGDDIDVYELEPEQVEKLKEEVQRREERSGYDCDTPAYRVFTEARVAPPGQLYVHFTAASFSHFAYGVSVEDGIALTRVCGPSERRRAPADNTDLSNSFFEVLWGFAFPVELSGHELRAGARKYGGRNGSRFLLFRSDEVVLAYHIGDEQTQALFVIGSEYDVVQGSLSGWDWVVETEDGELKFDNMEQIFQWVNR